MYEKDGKHHIRLGKVTARKGLKNEGIRLHGPDIPNGTPKTCTVSRKDMGTHYEYYVSVDVQLAVGDHQIEHEAVVLDVGSYRFLLSGVRVDPCLVREIQDLVADPGVHLLLHACMIAEGV